MANDRNAGRKPNGYESIRMTVPADLETDVKNLIRDWKHEKLVNKESTKESRTDNSNVHGEAQPQS